MKKLTSLTYIMATVIGSSVIAGNSDAHAWSARGLCDTPLFKNWKEQQAQRLWSPDAETLEAEKSGKVFTYNCFTLREIDEFFELHEDRIENTHFYPILRDSQGEDLVASKDDEC
jgi:hypothetical protein